MNIYKVEVSDGSKTYHYLLGAASIHTAVSRVLENAKREKRLNLERNTQVSARVYLKGLSKQQVTDFFKKQENLTENQS